MFCNERNFKMKKKKIGGLLFWLNAYNCCIIQVKHTFLLTFWENKFWVAIGTYKQWILTTSNNI